MMLNSLPFVRVYCTFVLCLLSSFRVGLFLEPPTTPPSHDTSGATSFQNSFQGSDVNGEFQHLTSDADGKWLYIGATNHLYQLDWDLRLLRDVQTGPVMDSPMCNAQGDCMQLAPGKNVSRVLTDNANKVLLVYEERKVLIACGTVQQGACKLHRLEDVSREIPVSRPHAVAANSANASTVAFLGPSSGQSPPLLYVGATYTYDYYRDKFPGVAARSLGETSLFSLADEGDISGQSTMIIRAEFRRDFLVSYIGGFHHDGFAYWALVQKKSPTDGLYESKLARACTTDLKFESYSELILECRGSNNEHYNLLQAIYVGRLGRDVLSSLSEEFRSRNHPDMQFLVGVFARGDYPWKPSAQSAVCVFPMLDIRASFQYNLERCNKGIGYRNLPQFGLNSQCMTSYRTVPENFCVKSHVGGDIVSPTVAVLTYEVTRLTAVTADITGPHTVLFLGTSDGKMKKVLLRDSRQAVEYEELSLSAGYPINPDLIVGADHKHIYAMARNQAFKVSTSVCSVHKNCSSCLTSRDPYCGWCTLHNKCTTVDACPEKDSEHGWLPISSNPQCLTVRNMNLRNASIMAPVDTEIRLEFNFLPQPVDNPVLYQCVLGGQYAIAEIKGPTVLACQLSALDSRPLIPAGKDHVTVPLQIWSGISRQVFFDDHFTFYDCSAHQLCTQCLRSDWPCNWCLQENRCVHDKGDCANQVLLSASSSQSSSAATLPQTLCPHINIVNMSDIMLPSGYQTAIRVPVLNLDKIKTVKAKFECLVQLENRDIRQPAVLQADGRTVECSPYSYVYSSNEPTLTVQLSLFVDSTYLVDRVNIRLYKCAALSDDCSRCLTLDPQYRCTWCGNSCKYSAVCPMDRTFRAGPDSCPAPVIESVWPLIGPKQGGTRVVIRGRDLGMSRDEIDGRVFVGGNPCEIVAYSVSKQIECITKPAQAVFEDQVTVLVRASGLKATSREYFRFVEPQVETYEPSFGPKSGGTRLRFNGTYMNAATSTNVLLGKLACVVDRNSIEPTSFTCLTSPAPIAGLTLTDITVQFDKANVSFYKPFTYVDDPIIESVEPLKSFRSGGRKLLIFGNNLNAVQNPRMYLLSNMGTNRTDDVHCTVINDTAMVCPSPSVPDAANRARRKPNADEDVHIHETVLDRAKRNPGHVEQLPAPRFERLGVGFRMDNVLAVRDLSQDFMMTVTPDPVYFDFPAKYKTHRGEPLIIEGENLNMASEADDIVVFVGDEPCNISLLAPNQLVCMPPVRKPRMLDMHGTKTGNGEPEVIVLVGNLRFPLGYLAYDNASPAFAWSFSWTVLGVIIAVVAALVLAMIVVVAFWWRKKSFQAEKEYQRIQLQMDSLESNVRSECKQAFAELQTDMSDLTSDLVALGIPFHTRRAYCTRTLFKEDHPVLLDWTHSVSNGYASHMHHSVAQFEQLLYQRHFVFLLVDTLEQQATFKAQDRVYVASLLTASLARNMQYCTEIVLMLLKDLISKSVDSKHPQIMLRRTESVVEKMLANWIALCLYDYLHETAGSSLFLLFKALKHQTEKGPIDALTSDARYTLSEDRLLKEQVQPEPVTLYIIPPNELDPDEKVICRALNCDTISQVKSKVLDMLYKNTPFSSRPSVFDVDLEWRCSPHGHILLQDEDRSSSPCVSGWKRLNTLEHYQISGSAILALVSKSKASFTYTTCSTHTYASIGSGSSSLLLSSHSPENSEHGVRFWHLMKPTDQARGQRSPTQTIPEIYLTRLLATKGTVQKFIDDFFQSALSVNREFPLIIKYLFDFFEQQADYHNLADSSVVYAWKNNSLPLRFWVNIIKNPDFIFDLEKNATLDSCLSVIAQTFMDACSTSEHKLGKDSPSNKLLFARDIPRYRQMVSRFYSDIRQLPVVSDQDLSAHMVHLSKAYAQEFNVRDCERELLGYVMKYKEPVLDALHSDSTARKHRFADLLEDVLEQLEQPHV